MAAFAKSLALSALLVAASLGAARIDPALGALVLLGGSFALVVNGYREKWPLGRATCLLPAAGALLAYAFQLAELGYPSAITPEFTIRPDPGLLAAGSAAGLLFGWIRGRSLRLSTGNGRLFAHGTPGGLITWMACFGASQASAAFGAYRVFEVTLAAGAFSTAMVIAASLVLLARASRARRLVSTSGPPPLPRAAVLVVLAALSIGVAAPATAQSVHDLDKMLTSADFPPGDWKADTANGGIGNFGGPQTYSSLTRYFHDVTIHPGPKPTRVVTYLKVRLVHAAAGTWLKDSVANELGTNRAPRVEFTPLALGEGAWTWRREKAMYASVVHGLWAVSIEEFWTSENEARIGMAQPLLRESLVKMLRSLHARLPVPREATTPPVALPDVPRHPVAAPPAVTPLLTAATKNFGKGAVEAATAAGAVLLLLGLANQLARALATSGPWRTRRREALRNWVEANQAEAQHVLSPGSILVDAVDHAGAEVRQAWQTVKGEVSSAGEDVAGDPSILLDTASGCLDTVKNTLSGALDGAHSLMQDARGLARDPQRLAAGASRIVSRIAQAATDLERVKAILAELSGLEDFQRSWDPNVPLLERIRSVGSGTLKAGSALETVGALGRAAGRTAGALGGAADDAGVAAAPGKTGSRAPSDFAASADDLPPRRPSRAASEVGEPDQGPKPSGHDDSGGSLEAASRFKGGRFVEYDLSKGGVRDVAKIAGEEDRYNRGTLRFWVPNAEAVDPAQITALVNRGDAAHRGLNLEAITRKVIEHEHVRRGLPVP